MKKYFLNTFIIAALLTVATACGDNFGTMNISPNSPSNPNTASILTGAIRNVGAAVTGIQPGLYVQHFGDVTYIEDSRYKTVNFDYNGFYAGPLMNLQFIIQQNTDAATKSNAAATGSNANQIATARILKAYLLQFLTDVW